MPITTDFEVFSSKYHKRDFYVSDPMDLPETARMIENLNNEFDTLYDEKQELEEKYNDIYDKYLSMYKLKHATKMLVIHMGMEENLASLHEVEGDHEEIWEYRVKDTVSNLDDEIRDVESAMELQLEEDIDCVYRKNQLIEKYLN